MDNEYVEFTKDMETIDTIQRMGSPGERLANA
jgi:hypothetical protein